MSGVTLKNRVPRTTAVTWSSGTTGAPVSAAVNIKDSEYLGIITSTALSGNTISFRVGASSSGTFYDLYRTSTGVQTQVTIDVTTSAARAYVLDSDRDVFAPWPWLKLVGNSTGEAATRTLYVVTK